MDIFRAVTWVFVDIVSLMLDINFETSIFSESEFFKNTYINAILVILNF